jgi:hypothetical protein
MGCATLCPTFSQTHLVTLFLSCIPANKDAAKICCRTFRRLFFVAALETRDPEFLFDPLNK